MNERTGTWNADRYAASPEPDATACFRHFPCRLELISTAKHIVAFQLTWTREASFTLPIWMQNLIPVEPCIMVGELLAGFVEIGENDPGRQSKLLEYGLFFGADIRASAGLGLIVPVLSILGGYGEDLAAVGTWQPMGSNMFPKIALVPAVPGVNMHHIRT